jgi:hypothetical protein
VLVCISGVTAKYAFPLDHNSRAFMLAAEIFAAALALAAGSLIVLRRRADARTVKSVRLPPSHSVLRSAAPYAAFGATYALALIVDHICAGLRAGAAFAYRPTYEIGCNIALVEFVPIAGLVAAAGRTMADRLRATASMTLMNASDFRRRASIDLIRISALALLAAGAVVGTAEVAIAACLAHLKLGLSAADLREVTFCARAAAVAYAPAAVVLIGAHILFALRRGWLPSLAVLAAVVVNLGVGLAIRAQGFPPRDTVVGVGCGLAVAAAIVIYGLGSTFRRLDYWYYAAY